MSIPTWVTPPGTLGTIPEGVFYAIPLVAEADTTVYYKVIAGKLPPGIFINETGILSGNPQARARVEGVAFDVARDTTSQFAVRAYTQTTVNGVIVVTGLADRTFTITVTGQSTVVWTTPSGNIGTYFDGTQITDLQVQYFDPDAYSPKIVTLIAGALPLGLTISTAGVISGYIVPNLDTVIPTTDYSFTLRVSNGSTSDVRSFSILVYDRNSSTADNTYITGDNTFITADSVPVQAPIITTPTGSIGSTRSDNFFAFQFTGIDFNNNAFEFIPTTELPPGLTLDPNSGWLYGYIPYGGVFSADYAFTLVAREVAAHNVISDPYTFSLTISGPVSSDIIWLTPTDAIERAKTPSSLGYIDNGATSTFYVEAKNVSGIQLQYRLLSGSASRLPQGLELLSSGHIAGRVSFDTFALDGGTTTFDVGLNTVIQPTTFDMVATFTVNAFSVNGLVSVNKTFSITVVRRYNEPYDNLYIQAMPPQLERAGLKTVLQDPIVFPPNSIYRNDDPNFGIARNVVYYHAYGLAPAALDDYVASLNLNHYWKQLTLGEIKTARALDDNGNVIYEVVYSEVIDTLVNNNGISVGKEVVLPFPVNHGTTTDITLVYPNSLQNMRDQVIDTVGQISNVLPRWMLSRQVDGSVLGFTPAFVIAYTKPGEAGQIAYNVQQTFGVQLNLLDFKADRYELDNYLTKNWNRDTQEWQPHPPSLTTFDFIGLPPFEPFRTTLAGAGTTAVNQTYTQVGPYKYAGSIDSDWIMYSLDLGNIWNIKNTLDTKISYTSTDLTNWTVVNGTSPAPTASFYQVGDMVEYQTSVRGYIATKTYICTQATTAGILPTNTSYWAEYSSNSAEWINDSDAITTWEDNLQTLASWTYGTPPGTTFDGNSLLFTDPVDMYSNNNTTDYDKYLLFPKYNIIDSLPHVNVVQWYNTYGDFVAWVNSQDVPVEWITVST